MAMKIKRGNRAPLLEDLELYQLGFNKENNHLYIKSEEDGTEKVIDFCEGIGGSGSRTFRIAFQPSKVLTYQSGVFNGRENYNYIQDQGYRNNDALLRLQDYQFFENSYFDININNKAIYRILVYKNQDSRLNYATFLKGLDNNIPYRSSIIFGPNGGTPDGAPDRRQLMNGFWGCYSGDDAWWYWNEAEFGYLEYNFESKVIGVYLNLFKPSYTWKFAGNEHLDLSNVVDDKVTFDFTISSVMEGNYNVNPGDTILVGI